MRFGFSSNGGIGFVGVWFERRRDVVCTHCRAKLRCRIAVEWMRVALRRSEMPLTLLFLTCRVSKESTVVGFHLVLGSSRIYGVDNQFGCLACLTPWRQSKLLCFCCVYRGRLSARKHTFEFIPSTTRNDPTLTILQLPQCHQVSRPATT